MRAAVPDGPPSPPAAPPAPPPDPASEALAEDLAALSHPQRLRLLRLLTRPRYGEEIAMALGVTRQAALKHIERLRERGFVRALHGRRPTGPVVEFQVVPQRLFAIGVDVGNLGRLEVEGGPRVKPAERTLMASAQAPAPEHGAAPPAQGTHLLVITGPTAGARMALPGGRERWTLGRDGDRDVPLGHDPFVSGRHAEIQAAPGGGFDLVDAYSSNGTFLNFARIPRGGRVRLRPGDVVGIGHTSLVLQQE